MGHNSNTNLAYEQKQQLWILGIRPSFKKILITTGLIQFLGF